MLMNDIAEFKLKGENSIQGIVTGENPAFAWNRKTSIGCLIQLSSI